MGSYLDELDARKAELQARFPGWQVWYVPGHNRTVTWCARPYPLLNEATPEDLAEAIGQATVPAVPLPAHRAATCWLRSAARCLTSKERAPG
jgi:hypothetical protein